MGKRSIVKIYKNSKRKLAKLYIFLNAARPPPQASSPAKVWLFATTKRSASLIKMRLLVQVRAEFLLPTTSLSPTVARGGFSALVRHPQPDSYGGIKGFAPPVPRRVSRRPYCHICESYCRPLASPLYINIVPHSGIFVNP